MQWRLQSSGLVSKVMRHGPGRACWSGCIVPVLPSRTNHVCIKCFDQLDMLVHSRNISICGLQVSPLTKLAGKCRVIHETLHLHCQRRWVPMCTQQTILLVMNVFSHPASIGSNHRETCLQC